MRVIFAGTPAFAARALEAVLAAGHEVPLVLTQPDRPSGRGQQVSQSAVKKLAAARNIPVYQPERLATDAQRAPLLQVPANVMVVAAYGLILPSVVLGHPRHGCLNIHASLLPRWRGAAPIQRALLAGDALTGICIMAMDAGLDTGPVISSNPVPIGSNDTAGTLHDKLAGLGAEAIVRALSGLERDGHVGWTPQPVDGITYAPKIGKAEARIDWGCSAESIQRQVRAFNPVPGAFTTHDGVTVKVWQAAIVAGNPASPGPGRVESAAGMLAVGCGDGRLLRLDELQPAGGRRMAGTLFLNGRPGVANVGFGT
ncbi:MAG: methionyl-tRNA formyltransferase [Betaproteobacteria bacterium]